MEKGKLIVIEGSCDGVGKSTQIEMLEAHLINDGYSIFKHHFPSYNEFQGSFVEEYLKGNLGNPKDLSPYLINSFYAVDRAITWNLYMKEHYDNGDIILLDRYTSSSLIYQSSLIEDLEKKKDFIKYVSDFEYNKLGIRKPDSTIFLHMPFDLALELRNKRGENGVSGDIHEKDLEFMKKVYESAMIVADILGWDTIECSKNGELRSREDIHDEVYRRTRKIIEN